MFDRGQRKLGDDLRHLDSSLARNQGWEVAGLGIRVADGSFELARSVS
jgi:hypothetical protein